MNIEGMIIAFAVMGLSISLHELGHWYFGNKFGYNPKFGLNLEGFRVEYSGVKINENTPKEAVIDTMILCRNYAFITAAGFLGVFPVLLWGFFFNERLLSYELTIMSLFYTIYEIVISFDKSTRMNIEAIKTEAP